MACNQTLTGIARDCESSMGGILEVLLANKEDVTAVTVTTNKVTAITMASSKTFKSYHFNKETGSITSNYVIDKTTGVRYVQSDLVMVFNRMETAKRVEVTALAQNELVALVKDANGAWWFLGYDDAVTASAGDGLTGTARGDRNGYSVTLQDTSHEMPFEVDADIIDDLRG